MRLPFVLSLCLPLPLLAGCPGGGGDEEAADSTATPAAATDTTASPVTDTSATSPSETETDTAPPDTETDGPIAGCECILDEVPADLNSAPEAPTCGEELCPLVSGGCVEVCGPEGTPLELDDPAALECALMVLRDRTPGIVTWSLSEGRGFFTEDGYVLVNEDGTAIRRNWVRQDLTFEVSDAMLGELPPPATYDACLADPDDLARFNCLGATLETQLGVCDEGWTCVECL